MRKILHAFIVPATRAPKLTLLALLLVTVAFGATATRLQVTSDLSQFAPDEGLVATFRDIDERFTATQTVSAIVDAGPGGNVLTPEAVVAARDLSRAIAADEVVAPFLAPDATDRPAVISYAEPFAAADDVIGEAVDDIDPTSFDVVAATIFESEHSAEIAGLLSQDLDPQGPRARAGLIVVELAAAVEDDDLAAVTEAIESILAGSGADGLRMSILTEATIDRAVEGGLKRDLPLLGGLSLLLVVGVLILMFRTVSDVLIGFVGLLATMAWMAGASTLLGPGFLGLIGPFGQVGIAVPVLLVGLGIDFHVHVTSRYREQQGRGDPPHRAASVAIATVGAAILLDTMATVGGFMSNFATPLPPIADLGVFTSVGVVAALIIFALGVPAARLLLDNRRAAKDAGTAFVAPPKAPKEPGRLVHLGTALATRRPLVVVGTTVVVLCGAGVVASGLGTEFDNRDFLPDSSTALTLIDRVDVLFGGDVGEQTYVLVDGDTTDPALLARAATFEDQLSEVDGIRTADGQARITSPFAIVDRLGSSGERTRTLLADDLDRWADPAAAAAEVPLPDDLDPEALLEAAGERGGLGALPADLRAAMERRLPEGRDPLAAIAALGDPDEIEAQVREALADEFAADRPDGVPLTSIVELAALAPGELRLDRLASAGFPLEILSAAEHQSLALVDRLDDAGWDADAPDRSAEALAAQLAIADDHEPAEMDAVLADDGLLIAVGTQVGDDRAAALASTLERLGDPVRAAGGELSVVSEALVVSEITTLLADAQMLAIVVSLLVASLLLVAATWLTDRSVMLGLIGVSPAICSLILTLATMRLLGLTINALTATVASLAVGIGVPYGIHITNRFRHSIREHETITETVRDTLQHTGAAVVGSAATTGLAFGVLVLATTTPLRQFGGVSTIMITYAFVTCLVVQPTLLTLWARARVRRSAHPAADRLDRRIDLPERIVVVEPATVPVTSDA